MKTNNLKLFLGIVAAFAALGPWNPDVRGGVESTNLASRTIADVTANSGSGSTEVTAEAPVIEEKMTGTRVYLPEMGDSMLRDLGNNCIYVSQSEEPTYNVAGLKMGPETGYYNVWVLNMTCDAVRSASTKDSRREKTAFQLSYFKGTIGNEEDLERVVREKLGTDSPKIQEKTELSEKERQKKIKEDIEDEIDELICKDSRGDDDYADCVLGNLGELKDIIEELEDMDRDDDMDLEDRMRLKSISKFRVAYERAKDSVTESFAELSISEDRSDRRAAQSLYKSLNSHARSLKDKDFAEEVNDLRQLHVSHTRLRAVYNEDVQNYFERNSEALKHDLTRAMRTGDQFQIDMANMRVQAYNNEYESYMSLFQNQNPADFSRNTDSASYLVYQSAYSDYINEFERLRIQQIYRQTDPGSIDPRTGRRTSPGAIGYNPRDSRSIFPSSLSYISNTNLNALAGQSVYAIPSVQQMTYGNIGQQGVPYQFQSPNGNSGLPVGQQRSGTPRMNRNVRGFGS